MGPFDTGMFALLIPIIALSIPIVALLVGHQQKMAQIIHSNASNVGPLKAEIDALRKEIAELRQLVHEQTIAVDNMMGAARPRPIEASAQASMIES